MRQPAGELADCLHFLRLEQGLARLLELELRLLALRHVTGDFCEADDLVAFKNRIDHDHRPEPGAVLAKPPAFGCEPAFLARLLQRLLGYSRLPVLGSVEPGEMLADNVLGSVALDPLRPGVPAYDIALCVEHKNSIIDDRLDQPFVQFRGIFLFPVVLAAFGQRMSHPGSVLR